ncbi:glycosyl transferase family 1 [Mycolicibacterium peregrinum]|uniref:glycosyltransferase family 4 protein n=1 Tax=Mycolicibacterium peregrinum TaxID=43304 RepID=UPI0007E9ECAB|nr:glycosyltransferase family 1 protein [Mycolicibacterium peregrinum]OBF44812.1 glycosyl transferase family 1 [Mycolicibacterium peregrinum]
MTERIDLLLDARHVNQSGIGTYIRTELPTVEKTLAEHGLSLAVLADEGKAPPVRNGTQVITARPSNAAMYSAGEQQVWRHALKSLRPRALWLPHYPFPFAILSPGNRHTKLFVTIHDILHLQPQSVSGKGFAYRTYARAMISMDARRCNTIFTPSRATADALAEISPRARTVVTPIPVGDAWLTPADAALAPLQGRYILFVGNAKWHKNLPVLFEAFREVATTIPQNLVIAGAGESVRNFDDRLAGYATELADRVQIIGRLDFETLRALVAGADLLVMPSLYEGAGLPPLEAMASHTAVLASSIPSLRETCGDGAEYFVPRDHQILAELLRTYCCDDEASAGLAARGWAHVNSRQSQINPTTAAETMCAELVENRTR